MGSPCLAVLLMLAQVVPAADHRLPIDRGELRQAAKSLMQAEDPCTTAAAVAAAMAAGGVDAPEAVRIAFERLRVLPRGSVAVLGHGGDDDLDRRVADWLADALAGSCIPLIDPNEATEIVESEADLRYLADADPERARNLLRAAPADFLIRTSIEVSISAAQQVYGISAHESIARATASLTRSADGSIASVAESSVRLVRTSPRAAIDDAVRKCVRLIAATMAEDILLESLRAASSIRLAAIDSSEEFGRDLAASLSRRLAGRGSAAWDPVEGRVVLSPRVPDQEVEAMLQEEGLAVIRRGLGIWTIRETGAGGATVFEWATRAWTVFAAMAIAAGIGWTVWKRAYAIEGGSPNC